MNYTSSYWIDSTLSTSYPSLNEDISTDVLVIGGGITGITTAFELQKEGLRTVLIESDKICHGTTGYTTAKITAGHNLIYSSLIDNFGLEKSQQYADANQYAINYIKDKVNDYNIDCNFSIQPNIVYTTEPINLANIQQELVACKRLGLPAQFVESTELPFDIVGGLLLKDQGQFHPLKYLKHLAEIYVKNGGKIFENTKAKSIDYDNKKVVTDQNVIQAKTIVVATHYPFFDKGHLFFLKMAPYTSYVIAIDGSKIQQSGMYISCDKEIRSFRKFKNNKESLLLIGGRNHKTGQAKNELDNYKVLESYSKDLYEDIKIKYMWATHDFVTGDRVPYIGTLSEKIENVYVATGYSKWGMTNGTVAGKIIRDLIIDGKSMWQDIYSPNRHATIESLSSLIKDGFDSGFEFFKSRFTSDDLETIKQLGYDQGAAIKINHQKIGVYRNKTGQFIALDLTCPHLKCHVEWNEGAKTWDCPCHGSRYEFDGTVIDGPSTENLKRLNLDDYGF